MKDTKTNKMHDYEIKVLENLQIIKQDAQPIQLSVIECEVIEVGTSVSNKYLSLNEAFDKLRIEREYPPSTDYSDFYKYIKVNSRKKLIDMMKF